MNRLLLALALASTASAADLSLETGYLWLKTPNPFTWWLPNYRKNPLPYRFVPTVLSIEWPSGWNNVDWQASLVHATIVSGPEHRWDGALLGARWEPYRDSAVTPLVSFRGGAGSIDASGVHYGQEKSLTFSYLIAIGVRWRLSPTSDLVVQSLTEHISNGWQTHPSEGIDLTGLSLNFRWKLPMRRRRPAPGRRSGAFRNGLPRAAA